MFGLLTGVPAELLGLLRDEINHRRQRSSRRSAQVVLRRGTRGPIVRAVQERLVELGESIDVDGIYGPATQAAITKRQSGAGIRADGLCGPETFAALWPPPAEGPPSS